MMKRFLLFCLFVFCLNKAACLENANAIPEVKYEMIPLQRWKVSIKELVALKEKLKVFISAEIQKEGSQLLRKYFKEFENIDEDSEDTEDTDFNESVETEEQDEKEIEKDTFLNRDDNDASDSFRFLKKAIAKKYATESNESEKVTDDFNTNGPVLIV